MSAGTIRKVVEQILEERDNELEGLESQIEALGHQVERNVEILQTVINEVFGEGANPGDPNTWDDNSIATYAWTLGALNSAFWDLEGKDVEFLQTLRKKHEGT